MQQQQQKATVKPWGGFKPGDVQTLPLKPGLYDAALVRIETIETRFGEKYRLTWDIRHGGEIHVINELCEMNNSADGKFMKRLAAVNGVRQLPDDVDLGKIRTSGPATLSLGEPSNGYAKIEDAYPTDGRTMASQTTRDVTNERATANASYASESPDAPF